MKKSIFIAIIILTILLTSCYQDEMFPPIGKSAYISISNNSETVVYWQLRKTTEEPLVFNRMGIGGRVVFETELDSTLILTFAGLSEDEIKIVGETIVFTQTTTEIHSKNITLDNRQKTASFTGDSSGVVCDIH